MLRACESDERNRDAQGRQDIRRSREQFLGLLHETMGVRYNGGGRSAFASHPVTGQPYKPANTMRSGELGLRTLAEAIMGHEFVEEYYHPSSGFPGGMKHLQEAAIDPTAFINISTFNSAVSGLLNAEIIAAFENPLYIGRTLIKTVPTSMNGHKKIGVNRISPQTSAAKGRKPGEKHAEVGYGDQYKLTPETVEQALKTKVTKEAVFFDLTGEVTTRATEVGDELAYGQEKDIADMVLGVTSLPSTYNFNGTSYETYQTASPWINDSVNPFSDIRDVDEARQLFVNMTDPITGREININSYNILVMPAKELLFRQQLFSVNIEIGTQLNSSFPSQWGTNSNQLNTVGRGTYQLTPLTAIWYNRATAASGLGLSAPNAQGLWILGDFQKAFEWQENWPLTTWQASADELVMKDEGLVMVHGANYRGSGFVNEPRYVNRNKAA